MGNGQRHRMLIASRIVPVRMGIAEYFRELGYDVDHASDRRNAMYRLPGEGQPANGYNIFVTDWFIPNNVNDNEDISYGNGFVDTISENEPSLAEYAKIAKDMIRCSPDWQPLGALLVPMAKISSTPVFLISPSYLPDILKEELSRRGHMETNIDQVVLQPIVAYASKIDVPHETYSTDGLLDLSQVKELDVIDICNRIVNRIRS
ncbi:MAG: hypothetical protein ABIA21_04215 [Candidatus Aenigmatarchaeota archaeon]